MAKHNHEWRYIRDSSSTDYDLYNCNCGSIIRVFFDKRIEKPILIEAGDIKGNRINPEIVYSELKKIKDKETKSTTGFFFMEL